MIDDLEYRKQQDASAIDELDQRLVRVLAQVTLRLNHGQRSTAKTKIEETHTRLERQKKQPAGKSSSIKAMKRESSTYTKRAVRPHGCSHLERRIYRIF